MTKLTTADAPPAVIWNEFEERESEACTAPFEVPLLIDDELEEAKLELVGELDEDSDEELVVLPLLAVLPLHPV